MGQSFGGESDKGGSEGGGVQRSGVDQAEGTAMIEAVRFRPGDKVHVWRVDEYEPDVIVSHREWTHDSGNVFIAYKLKSGGECSANSIQEFADPDWFKATRKNKARRRVLGG